MPANSSQTNNRAKVEDTVLPLPTDKRKGNHGQKRHSLFPSLYLKMFTPSACTCRCEQPQIQQVEKRVLPTHPSVWGLAAQPAAALLTAWLPCPLAPLKAEAFASFTAEASAWSMDGPCSQAVDPLGHCEGHCSFQHLCVCEHPV